MITAIRNSRDGGDNTKGPFRSHKQAGEVITGNPFVGLDACVHDLSGWEYNFKSENVIFGHAILYAPGSPCTDGSVPPHGGEFEACGIGGIEKPELFDFLLKISGNHTGLD